MFVRAWYVCKHPNYVIFENWHLVCTKILRELTPGEWGGVQLLDSLENVLWHSGNSSQNMETPIKWMFLWAMAAGSYTLFVVPVTLSTGLPGSVNWSSKYSILQVTKTPICKQLVLLLWRSPSIYCVNFPHSLTEGFYCMIKSLIGHKFPLNLRG